MKNADSVYIENLNRELSLLDDVNPVDIYKALEKFVQNKSLFKDFVESVVLDLNISGTAC